MYMYVCLCVCGCVYLLNIKSLNAKYLITCKGKSKNKRSVDSDSDYIICAGYSYDDISQICCGKTIFVKKYNRSCCGNGYIYSGIHLENNSIYLFPNYHCRYIIIILYNTHLIPKPFISHLYLK